MSKTQYNAEAPAAPVNPLIARLMGLEVAEAAADWDAMAEASRRDQANTQAALKVFASLPIEAARMGWGSAPLRERTA